MSDTTKYKDSNKVIKEFYESVQDDYPHLTYKDFERVCVAPFIHLRKSIRYDELIDIRYLNFGIFMVKPRRVIYYFNTGKRSYESGRITRKMWYERLVMYIKRIDSNPTHFKHWPQEVRAIREELNKLISEPVEIKIDVDGFIYIVENNVVKPNPETLLIQPFNLIWDQDESERKDWAMQQFMFIEFMMSMKKSNPFNGYTDNDERLHYVLLHHRRLTKDSSTGEPNNPFDIPLVISAMEVYKEFQDKAVPSAKYYNSAVAAADKLSQFFLDFDMNDTNERTGNPLYKPADITRALKETSEILKTLGSLREKVEQEIFESGKGKAGREINVFER